MGHQIRVNNKHKVRNGMVLRFFIVVFLFETIKKLIGSKIESRILSPLKIFLSPTDWLRFIVDTNFSFLLTPHLTEPERSVVLGGEIAASLL